MATNTHHDSIARNQLARSAQRLDRQQWIFDGLRIGEIVERIDADDNELFARLLDATNNGDAGAGTIALYSILPRLITNIQQATRGACRSRALDEMLGFAWIIIREAGDTLPRDRCIHLVVNRVRFRSRRSVNPHRADRPHMSTRETLRCPQQFDSMSPYTSQDPDPVGDAVMRRLEVERVGKIVTEAIDGGAIDADNWTALLDARVLGVRPSCEHRSMSGTWSAIWRTVHRVRTLTEINA